MRHKSENTEVQKIYIHQHDRLLVLLRDTFFQFYDEYIFPDLLYPKSVHENVDCSWHFTRNEFSTLNNNTHTTHICDKIDTVKL